MEEKEIGVLIIHTDRQTGEYKKYEIYPRKFLEDIPAKVEEWNKNEKMDTVCKLYDDPLLVQMADDTHASFTRNILINSLKSIVCDIESAVNNLESWQEEVVSKLDELKEEEKC